MPSETNRYLLRAALEEYIRMGPEARRSVLQRLTERLPQHQPAEHASALVEANNAVALAEQLAREYRAGSRTQRDIVRELRRQIPWLIDESGNDNLAFQLSSFGYYLVIM